MFSTKLKYIALASFLIGSSTSFAAFFPYAGITGIAHIMGVFRYDSTGNAGTISFDEPGATAGIQGFTVSGKFYIQTIGWATFVTGTRILPPTSGNVTDLWALSGTIMSNAGPISLNGTAQYNPITKALIGYGYNNAIGNVPFGISISSTGITSSGITPAFLGRVKILGITGGGKSYDTLNPLGPKFNASAMNDTLNSIRKNVAILSRNIPSNLANTSFGVSTPVALGNKLFFINTTSTPKTLNYSSIKSYFPTASVDSLIVIGGDVIIDTDVPVIPTSSQAKGIIVLRNDHGLGGNMIVTKAVKTIESSLFLEGTLYSGDNKTNLYNNTTEKVALLSQDVTKQLYIHGSLLSRNTIGGAVQSGSPTCVYGEDNCTYEKAIQYDLNYFRGYDPTIPANRAFRDTSLDTYSVVIESDARTVSSPPPGLEVK